MRVRMIKSQRACPGGIRSETYHAGQEYTVTDDNIVQAFIEAGAIEIVEDKAIHAAPETKPIRSRRRAKV